MNALTGKLIGAAIGGVIGYIVGDVIVEIIRLKEFQNEHSDDFEYEDLDEDPGNDDETNLEKEPTTLASQPKKLRPRGKVKSYTEYFEKQGKPELAALVRKYTVGAGEDERINGMKIDQATDDELAELEVRIDPDSPTDPSIISLAEYANAEGYEQLTFDYYDDDVVTDEHDNPIHRPDDILGDEWSVSFGHLSQDEDVVYVKNEAKKAMYEVVRMNKNYAPEPRRRDRIDRMGEEQRDAEEDNA